jgi:hypothetical protein
MTRLQKFNNLGNHPWFQKLTRRLTSKERLLAEAFISENEALGRAQFEFKLNRLFLDKEKPKNWAIILELLMISNMEDKK